MRRVSTRTDRLRIGVGLALGITLAIGAPGVQYAATQLSHPVGEYSYPMRPIFLGRGTAASVDGARIADTGAIRTRRPGRTEATLIDIAGPAVRGDVLPAVNHRRLFARRGVFDPLSLSIAGVTSLQIDTPVGRIEAEAVGAMAAFSCGGRRQTRTRIERLRINGQPVSQLNAPSGTVVDVGALRLAINQRSRPGPGQIEVTALRITGRVPTAGLLDITIGYARAGVRHCGPVRRGPHWAAILQGARPPMDPFEQHGKDAALGCLDRADDAVTPACALRHRPALVPATAPDLEPLRPEPELRPARPSDTKRAVEEPLLDRRGSTQPASPSDEASTPEEPAQTEEPPSDPDGEAPPRLPSIPIPDPLVPDGL